MKPCFKDVLFWAAAVFEAKRKGYTILHPIPCKSESEKQKRTSLVCTTLVTPRPLADRRHMLLACLPHR